MKQGLFFLVPMLLFTMTTCALSADSSYVETPITLHTSTGDIFGTLTTPKQFSVIPVALLIAGSGPTDRNGNSYLLKGNNNSLKQIADTLAGSGIASVRFDKRGISASYAAMKNPADLRFENYISDVVDWIALLRKDSRFNQVIVIGHSEGSLIGMIAAQHADKYVSIAGIAQSADHILKEQLAGLPMPLKDTCFMIVDSLKAGNTYANVPKSLSMYFYANVQPYLISWFRYDPSVEIKKLTIPILILQGTNDLQVKEKEAVLLAKANPAAKLLLIENMNHVLKIVAGNADANVKAYSDPSLPVSTTLIKAIIDFIKAK